MHNRHVKSESSSNFNRLFIPGPHNAESPRPTIDHVVLHYAYSQGRSELKFIIGTGLCVIGTIIWAATLIATPMLVDLTVISLGVIIGGGITASGIILICLPTNSIRFSYFDKT